MEAGEDTDFILCSLRDSTRVLLLFEPYLSTIKNRPRAEAIYSVIMVGDRRIELLTSSVSRKRSTSELTAHS